ncbi:MAG: hypothetical protein ACE5OZ_16790 [Candidatus Heimdallarchaeota archaeon]
MPTKNRNYGANGETPILKLTTSLDEIRCFVSLVGGTFEDEEDTAFLLAGLGVPQRERQVIIRNLYS